MCPSTHDPMFNFILTNVFICLHNISRFAAHLNLDEKGDLSCCPDGPMNIHNDICEFQFIILL